MSEYTRQYKRRDSERRRRKRRQRRIAFGILCGIILLLTGILILQLRKNRVKDGETAQGGTASVSESTASLSGAVESTPAGSEEPQDVSAGSDGAGGDNAAPAESTPESTQPAPEAGTMLTLTEEQKYSGYLILVNAANGYRFDENAGVVNPVDIRENQSVPYPVAREGLMLDASILPAVDRIIAACNEAMGTDYTSITSAYRTIEYQQRVWDEAAYEYGDAYAEQYVAVPGFSEHHTGYALDFGIVYGDGSEGSFSASDNAIWMRDHCAEYGFIRRYAEDKTEITGISNEAWHFRYVGVPHATYMTQNNLCLEEYLDFLRTNTSQGSPLSVSCDTGIFDVFFTTDTVIPEPAGSYEISGNNVDGYIITVQR